MSEQILVIERRHLERYISGKNGLIQGVGEALVDIISENHEFKPRPEMELDATYKQIIPYVAVCRGGDILTLRRLNKGGEARLHGLISIGVGGHINPVDEAEGGSVLMSGLRREVAEELYIERELSLTPLGVINDDGNEVGRVHLGFLFRMEVEGEVLVRETEKLAGEWVSLANISTLAPEMETWSQIALEALI